MQTSYLASLRLKPVYAAAVAFIDKLVASGVPLENIQASNFESRKGMTQGVVKTGPNKGKANGKFPNQTVIIIPQAEVTSMKGDKPQWGEFNTFTDRNVKEAQGIYSGEVQRTPDAPTVVKQMKDRVVVAVAAAA